MIYKILRDEEYMNLIIDGETNGSSVDIKDKYIHFSSKEQLLETLEKHFVDEFDLHIISVDESNIDEIKWEKSRGGALFPHLYRKLKNSDIIDHWEIPDNSRLPKNIFK